MRSRAAILLVSLLAACNAGQEPNPCGAADPVTVTVSPGPTPTVTWAPACGVAWVTVAEARLDGPTAWYVQTTDGRNTIESGVRYGRRPAGTAVLVGPTPLVPGTTYRVNLVAAEPLPEGVTAFSGVGMATFTP